MGGQITVNAPSTSTAATQIKLCKGIRVEILTNMCIGLCDPFVRIAHI